METENRMKELAGNLKRDGKELLGESVGLVMGFFKRGACTVQAVANKWKAFAQGISGAVDTLMKPPFADYGPEAPPPELDAAAQPTVTFTSRVEGVIAENQQMPLHEANELVKHLGEQFVAEGRAPAPVQVKVDYILDGQTDRYWLPLEIGAGGSLLDQMAHRLEAYRTNPAKLEQLFAKVDPDFKAELQAEFLPVLHDSVNHLYDRVVVFFARHCEISALEQVMNQCANSLPESAQQNYQALTQAAVINLRRMANDDLYRAEPPTQARVTAQARPVEHSPTSRPQVAGPRREVPRPSVKITLRAIREDRAQPHTPKSPRPKER